MAGDWIKMRVNLTSDPAVIGVATSLEISEHEVVGLLHWLWTWADQQTEDGHARGVTSAWVDRYSGKPGLADALIEVGWLDFDDNGIHFPNFERHNGQTAKKRAQSAARQQRARAKTKRPTAKMNSKVPTKVKALVKVAKEEFAHLLENPERKKALGLWVQHRQALSAKGYTKVSARAFLRKVDGMDVDDFVGQVEHSVAQGYTGLYAPSGGNRGRGNQKGNGPSDRTRGDYPEPRGTGPEVA